MSADVLVTGPTGTVGRYVVQGLVERGIGVRAAVRPVHDAPAPTALADVHSVPFDFEKAATFEPALDGVDRVFLMRPPQISDTKRYLRPFVQLCARRRVRHVVVLSVLGVNPAMPHWRVERDVAAAGLPHSLVRPAYFMQNLETALRDDIVQHDRIRLAAGQGRTSFVDTRDVAEIVVRALDGAAVGARTYTLTGPEALNWSAVASLLSAELARPIVYEPIGLLTGRRELRAAGAPAGYANVQTVINAVARFGLADKVTDELAQALGRVPGTLADYVHARRDVWQTP